MFHVKQEKNFAIVSRCFPATNETYHYLKEHWVGCNYGKPNTVPFAWYLFANYR